VSYVSVHWNKSTSFEPMGVCLVSFMVFVVIRFAMGILFLVGYPEREPNSTARKKKETH